MVIRHIEKINHSLLMLGDYIRNFSVEFMAQSLSWENLLNDLQNLELGGAGTAANTDSWYE